MSTAIMILIIVAAGFIVWPFYLVTHTLTITSKPSNGTALSGVINETGNLLVDTGSVSVPASTTNQAVTFAFTSATVQFFEFLADQNCTLKTNSSGSPADTISLVAGIPYQWSKSGYFAYPLAGNVTSLFVTSTPSTIFQARAVTS